MLRLNGRRRIGWSLIAAFLLTTACAGVERAVAAAEDSRRIRQTDPPQPPLRGRERFDPAHLRLRALIYDEQGRRKPAGEVDRAALLEALRAASTIIDRQALWSERAAEEAINYGWEIQRDLQSGFTVALALAPSKEEERGWMYRKQALTLRLMHFLLETRKRHPDYFKFAWKDGTPFAVLIAELESTRSAMNLRGLLMPDQWGALYALSWMDEPGAVLMRDGVVFVDAAVPGKLMANGSYFDHFEIGPRPRPRKAQIPIGDPAEAGPRRGFRDSRGRIYIPVEELQRQGELDLRVNPPAQLVQLSAYSGPRSAGRGSEERR